MLEHEQYYRKGGTYELPIEIYNQLIGEIEDAQEKRNIYKQRCERAIGRISLLKMDDITIETNKALDYVLKPLLGSDEE